MDSVTPVPVVDANRRETRRPANWSAVARLSDGLEVPCIVRDVSKTGARLAVPSNFPADRRFLLKVEERGFAFAVTLRWRRGNSLGVQIEKVAKLGAAAQQLTAGDQASPLAALAQ